MNVEMYKITKLMRMKIMTWIVNYEMLSFYHQGRLNFLNVPFSNMFQKFEKLMIQI
jgi:hypothetical protein